MVSPTEHPFVREAGRTVSYDRGEDSVGPVAEEKQQRVEEMIEQHWRQVEKTPMRDERRVPLPTTGQPRDTVELEQLLDNYKQGVSLTFLICFTGFKILNVLYKRNSTFKI